MERMEWIEDLDGRVFYAQGIVSVGALTRMFIAWCQLVGCLLITRAGSNHARLLSSRRGARRCLSGQVPRSAQARLP